MRLRTVAGVLTGFGQPMRFTMDDANALFPIEVGRERLSVVP